MPLDELPPFDAAKHLFPETHLAMPDQWDRACSLLTDAEHQGLLDAPVNPLTRDFKPGDKVTIMEPVPELSELNPVRFKVIAEQLWLLGYLENRPGSDLSGSIQSTPAFQSAIRRFQQEAGLAVDGWAGNQTWKAIKSLVNFESKTKIDLWKRPDGIFFRAFRRAAQLRLWSYGLAEKKPGPGFNSIPSGNIQRFKKALWSLSLIDDYNSNIPRTVLFSILFDPDRLVKAAAGFKPIRKQLFASDDSFADNIHNSDKHQGVLQIKRRFLVNMAKIELWLLGSDIHIDGEDDYKVKGLTPKRLFGGTDREIKKYLQEYWEKLSDFKEEMIRDKAKAITPSLFISFMEPDKTNQKDLVDFTQEDYSQKIVEDFEKESNTQELVIASYREGKSLGMKLWDGLKRLWAWVKKGVEKIVSFGKNIFRAFYRFAMKGFKIVKTAVSAFTKSMGQYFSGLIEVDAKNPVVVAIRKDMDFQMIADETASPSDLSSAAKAVRRFGAMFYFSCRIVGVFIDILINAVAGVTGWARVLMSLVKGYRSLVPAYREMALVL